ncbi:phage portal protein [Nitratireductor sp. ac15]
MAKATKSMTKGQLASLVRSEIDDAIGYDESDISVRRNKALDYYNGELTDVPAEEGRSSVTSHDVADVIGWVLPGLMRTFTSGDVVAEYEPQTPGDEEFAQQATDYINYVFLRECEGYRVLYNACFEGLLFGNGIIKHWWDTKPRYSTEDYTGLSDEAYTLLVQDENVKVLQHSEVVEIEEQQDPETGEPVQVETRTHDVKIRCVKEKGRLRIMALPPEEFLIERYATSIEDARFLCHRRSVTRADLIAEGYDEKEVMDIGSDQELESTDEHLARWDDMSTGNDRKSRDDPLMQEVEVFECYIMTDYDGDGHPEWRKVVMAGSGGEKSILGNDEWGDDVPFSDVAPDPRPHRWDGRSVFDEVQDIARVKTALTRQTLDNLYLTNHPQRAANPTNIKNQDELLEPTLGGIVWADDPDAIKTLDVPFVAGNSFQMLEYMDSITEKRTGVSRQSASLDGQELQNQSATAAQLAHDTAHAKQELYARNIAEIGLKRLFKCLLRIIVKHQDQPRTIRLRDKWVEMDPRVWNADMDVSINVGLGSGSRERDMQVLSMISAEQKAIIQTMGPMNPIVTPERYVATLHKMVETGGLKSPEQYFAEVTPETMQALQMQAEQAANAPDPEMQKAMAKAQADQQSQQAKMQLEIQKARADHELQMQKLRVESELRREEANRDFELKREQLAAEMQLKRELMAEELRLKREVATADAALKVSTSQVHMGGEPG